MSTPRTPSGYSSFRVGRAQVVAQGPLVTAFTVAMADASLHAWAARQPGARAMTGRATAWATTLVDGVEVVVRHSQHGGLLAPLTRDLFLAPTRAPRELATALRLASAGVPTPELLAYAVYPAAGPYRRADVATRFIPGRTLPDAWRLAPDSGARSALLDALATLLTLLRRAGAHHADLNVRNVLVRDSAGAPSAAVLDVDRVSFGAPGDAGIAGRNLDRLLRSVAKAGAGIELTSRQVERLRESTAAVA